MKLEVLLESESEVNFREVRRMNLRNGTYWSLRE